MAEIVVVEKRPTVIVNPSGSQVLVTGAHSQVIVSEEGVAGPSGIGASRFEHVQTASLAVWTINHNLGYRPDITLFSAGGIKVDAEILHVTLNQATATFDIPFSGSAICE